MSKISKVHDKVAKLLSEYPESRNNDNYLFRLYAQIYYGMILPPIETIVSYETISRVRRDFQSKGLYLAEDRVAKARSKQKQEFKEEYKKEHAPKAVGM
ncbi:hypothetical protein [Dehalobacter sp. 4CP]|uniref:hypothetical protein n=1 Tax=Dehalobacter sp. CP TaxID=2594474 RepID=UPI0039E73C02